jgi:hypothetical protein
MRRPFVLAIVALALSIIVSVPANATGVLVGTLAQGYNTFPFGGPFSGYPGTEYQQVYNQSLFPVMDITNITFFNSGGYTFANASYDIYLSVTSKAVNGLDNVTLSNNVTGTNTFFWNGSLSGNPGSSFSFYGPAFHYDPSMGNLLIDIFRTGSEIGGSCDAMNGTFGDLSSRAQDFGAHNTSYGLVTGFNYVPLPPSALLLGSGLLGLAGWRRFWKG